MFRQKAPLKLLLGVKLVKVKHQARWNVCREDKVTNSSLRFDIINFDSEKCSKRQRWNEIELKMQWTGGVNAALKEIGDKNCSEMTLICSYLESLGWDVSFINLNEKFFSTHYRFVISIAKSLKIITKLANKPGSIPT